MNKIAITSAIILVFLILVVFFLGGFEAKQADEVKPFKTATGNFVIEQDVNLPTMGRHQTVGGVCFIKLQRYPVCMQHEMRHCIEGDWHKGVKSDQDCYE
ncbi:MULTISPECIES: hypothetical protein [unclassified Pseudoalteromonas]|uniref:hypothetical protein n=1 Tax=unclassified Pseudoalteromonas TaxID=194690 RepID=UPI00390C7200